MVFRFSDFIEKLLMRRKPGPTKGPSHRNYVARPVLRANVLREFSWENENILILGRETGLHDLAKELASLGASVSFRFLTQLQELYQLPLEQYSTIIMSDRFDGQQCNVIDVGGILRRADSNLRLVWASEQFKLSAVATTMDGRFLRCTVGASCISGSFGSLPEITPALTAFYKSCVPAILVGLMFALQIWGREKLLRDRK